MSARILPVFVLLVLAGGLPGTGLLQGQPLFPSKQNVQPALEDSPERSAAEPIAEVRIDANGDAVPDRTGDTVTVAGRVTAGRGRLPVPVSDIAALQDRTAGIHMTLPEGPPVKRGDSLRARGVVTHKYGLTQLEVSGYNVLEAPPRVPDPVPLTVAAASGERYEGMLVRIEGYVTKSGANDGGTYRHVRDRATNVEDPPPMESPKITIFASTSETGRIGLDRFEKGDQIQVTGVLGQHDYEASYTDFYQVIPRRSSDLATVGLWAYLWPGIYVVLGGVGLAVLGIIYGLQAAVRWRTRKLEKNKETLRNQEERLRSITENVSDGIYRSTPDEGIVYANQALAEMFGYQGTDELFQVDPTTLYANPDERERVTEKSNRQGGLGGLEVQFRRKDGTTFTGLLSGTVVRGDDGEVRCYDGAVSDITERKRQKQTLRKRQEKLEALYAATDRLLRASSEEEVGKVLTRLIPEALGYRGVSVRFVQQGRLEASHVSEATSEFMPERPDFDIDGDSAVAEVYRTGESLVVEDLEEAQIEDPNDYGGLRASVVVPMGDHGVFAVASPKPKAIGSFDTHLIEVLGTYATVVLDRLEQERALRSAKERAEQARAEAVEASKAKSAFLANMSHEIRTPLTSIIGFAEAIGEEIQALEDGPEEEDLSQLDRFSGLIEQGGKRLLGTLDGVLNLSKLEAGQVELDTKPVDLAAQAQQTAEEFRPEAREKGLTLEVQAEDPPVWAKADEGGVQVVLQNLLSNAIKYTEEGKAQVSVYRENGAAALAVEDDGIGMEPEQADALFEPFRQASEGFGRKFEGTGIGLAVMKKAIEQMDGQIDLKTEKGEGSRFTIRLPRAENVSA